MDGCNYGILLDLNFTTNGDDKVSSGASYTVSQAEAKEENLKNNKKNKKNNNINKNKKNNI